MPAEPTTEPERTSDGRWIVVDGRRWRASDPSIPEPFRKELVDELMAARRAVGVARRAGSSTDEIAARARVQHAKVALGERGEPWWEEATEAGTGDRVEAAILALAGHRAPDKTICPSDAARAVGGDTWRRVMPVARNVAVDLAARGLVDITQRGEVLDPGTPLHGPVRIRLRS